MEVGLLPLLQGPLLGCVSAGWNALFCAFYTSCNTFLGPRLGVFLHESSPNLPSTWRSQVSFGGMFGACLLAGQQCFLCFSPCFLSLQHCVTCVSLSYSPSWCLHFLQVRVVYVVWISGRSKPLPPLLHRTSSTPVFITSPIGVNFVVFLRYSLADFSGQQPFLVVFLSQSHFLEVLFLFFFSVWVALYIIWAEMPIDLGTCFWVVPFSSLQGCTTSHFASLLRFLKAWWGELSYLEDEDCVYSSFVWLLQLCDYLFWVARGWHGWGYPTGCECLERVQQLDSSIPHPELPRLSAHSSSSSWHSP